MKRPFVYMPFIVVLAAAGCLGDSQRDPVSPPERPPLGGTLTPTQAFFTSAQAQDLANSPMRPLSSQVPAQMFNDARLQLKAIYPDITFQYDATDFTPNVYAICVTDTPKVVVSAGLGRLSAIQYEGFVMAVAYGAASFKAGTPKNAHGFSPRSNADYFAFQTISRSVWFGNGWVPGVAGAVEQWRTVFSLIDATDAQGDASDPANNPSLSCRLQVIGTAAQGDPLPACATPATRPAH